MKKRLSMLLAVLLAFALVAAACGDDDDDGGDTTTTAAADTETTAAPDEGDAATTTEAGAETTAAPSDGAEGVTVGVVYDIGGRGDQSFNDAAAAGLDQATEELGIVPSEASPNADGSNRGELLQAAAEDNELVFGIGFLFAETIGQAALDNPDVNFGVVDGFVEDAPENLAMLLFAEEQGSFLVGAAAALKSETGNIGFIGGVNTELIQKFEAGYVAGAQAVNPDIEVQVQYITEPPDFAGFNDPARAKVIAESMYEAGADVVYHAAGGSGTGLFEAALEYSESSGSKVWAIGVDSDQYESADPAVQEYILTSMLKRVDVAVYNTIEAQVNGSFAGGVQTFDLSVDGVGYSTSGGFVDDIADQLDEFAAQIISGEIEVPTVP